MHFCSLLNICSDLFVNFFDVFLDGLIFKFYMFVHFWWFDISVWNETFWTYNHSWRHWWCMCHCGIFRWWTFWAFRTFWARFIFLLGSINFERSHFFLVFLDLFLFPSNLTLFEPLLNPEDLQVILLTFQLFWRSL